jgi:hypothetical protein
MNKGTFSITSYDFGARMAPWYLQYPEAFLRHIGDQEIQHLTNKLGLKFLRTTYSRGSEIIFVFNVIDEHLFMLAKINLGI